MSEKDFNHFGWINRRNFVGRVGAGIAAGLAGCGAAEDGPTERETPGEGPTEVGAQNGEETPTETPTPIEAEPTSEPEGRTLQVTSTADSGPGSLRDALTEAQAGDIITFDPTVFAPDAPATIAVRSELPHVRTDRLTIDASDTGVVLDGSGLSGNWVAGLQIVSSRANVIRGLQFRNFPGPGIAISGGARDNVIGGDRTVGRGPSGQGNVFVHNTVGVDLSTPTTTNNVVVGNLIGADGSGTTPAGNRRSGVAISEGASGNRIGPDNLVTKTGRCGIEISGAETRHNLITQNRIHDNGAGGICLLFGANEGVRAPLITSIDWSAGGVTATACPGCKLEVFSDGDDEGGTYEGQMTTDGDGWFTFEKGTAFTGPNVTVTATDDAGNTSEFARPAPADWGPLTLQVGNHQPPSQLRPKRSGELADNRMATNFVGPLLWEEIVDSHEQLSEYLLDLGVKQVNTCLNEIEPPITWDASEFDIPPEYDRVIDTLRQNGVEVNYMLHFWDKAGHSRGERLSTPRFQTEEQVEDFLDYIRFIVRHFRGRVQYYTLWSEPDNCHQGGGIKCIRVADYIELAKRVIPVIREEDPDARISVAPVVLFYERDFIPTVLRSEVGPMFDVVQWHGQYDVRPDNDVYGSYYYDYYSIVEDIRETARASGFRGEFWSTDMWWCSDPFPGEDPGDQPWRDCKGTDKVAAKYNARAVVAHLGMDISAGQENGNPPLDSPWSYPTVQLLSTVTAGATPTDLAAEISGGPPDVRLVSYMFELPDGDTLLALWDDGVAVERDSAVATTVSLSDLGHRAASGIDVLYGFEQELITDTENGNLIIRNLMVKDYPIILRLSD